MKILLRKCASYAAVSAAILMGMSILLVLVFRWVPVPFSALMLERDLEAWSDNAPYQRVYNWQSWDNIAPTIKLAVIAAEDQKFSDHWGFDFDAIGAAMAHNEKGGKLRGASTISQQVAKNLFLWSSRSWLRKAFETWYTFWIEMLWPKERILEVYLNIVEWGRGVYGIQAAAKNYYGINAARLNETQASALAAVLPNPRVWRPTQPSAMVKRRANWIARQMRQLGGHDFLNNLDTVTPKNSRK